MVSSTAAGGRVSDAVRSLEWTAEIEKTTRAIPPPRGLARFRRDREYAYDDRAAVAVGARRTTAFDALPKTSALLATTSHAPRVRSAARADVVLVGALRTTTTLRFRSFYRTPALTLAVQRRQGAEPAPLVRGGPVQTMVAGQVPFVVPRVLDTGYFPPKRADWILEERIDGSPVVRGDVDAAAREMLTSLPPMWTRFGIEHTALGEQSRARALATFTALAQEPPDGLWLAGVDRAATLRRVTALLADRRPLSEGISHGDPGVGNLLRLPDGRLALIDWEFAGRGPVAHDAMKVLLSAPDPVGLTALLHAPDVGEHAMPWRRQVATSIVLFLRGWRERHRRAVRQGRLAGHQRRMHRTIETLSLLLD